MGLSVGYALDLFKGTKNGNVRNCYTYALNADKIGDTNRKGYNNGLIDTPEEMDYLKKEVRKAFGVEFSFDGISQGSIDKLKKDSPAEYKASLARIKEQEDAIDAKRDKLHDKAKSIQEKVDKNYKDHYDFGYSNLIDGKLEDTEFTVTVKSNMKLADIKREFGLPDGALITRNPELKKYLKTEQIPAWYERVFNKAKTDYDAIEIPAGTRFYVKTSQCNVQ